MTGLFTDTDANATDTLYAFLRGLKAKVTWETVQIELPLHPDFPSLLSLSELLTDWKIDNTALQLNTVEQLRELPLPFIAHLRQNNGWYVLVTNVAGDAITFVDSRDGRRMTTLNEFEKQWTGVVLLAVTGEQSGEPDYETNRKHERLQKLRRPFLTIGTLFLLFFVILSVAKELTTPNWLLLVTKAIGSMLSGLLVAKQLGNTNALTDRLCRINSQTNCDSVLDSPGAKLWGWLSWADVGLLYFAGGLLTVLLGATQLQNGQEMVQPLLSVLALLALPYTIFSVYYQARVVKKWCTLCLAVQGVLLIEGVSAITRGVGLPALWQPYAAVAVAFLLPTLAWMLVKPLLASRAKSQQEHSELLRFKRDPDLFQAMLTQQPQMPPIPEDLHPIVLGNPNAEHTITMVTNPYCGPCAKAHTALDALINRNTNVKGAIIFMCDGADGRATQVALHALALTERGNAAKAMTDWYGQLEKNYDNWANQHPVSSDRTDLITITNQQRQWCHLAGITATPTLYVDGHQLPDNYRLDGLRWLMNELEPVNAEPALNV